MRWLFWAAVVILGYTYFGYALWLWIRCRWRTRPIRSGPYCPPLSILMVVRDEASVLERKLNNLLQLDYPEDRREILVVSDGSTDDTNRILTAAAETSKIRTFLSPEPQGKAAGLNNAINAAAGEIVVFTDARQKIEENAVKLLLENFADPEVGCASGELMLGDPDSGEHARGTGSYWKFEKQIRRMESRSGSVIGATGALYAARRALLVTLPAETILDDVYLPMHVLQQGRRVVFDPRARAWDVPDLGQRREFARKVRTLTGNYQLLRLAPWLLRGSNPEQFAFLSHKLLRLAAPFALGVALATSLLASGTVYKVALGLQLTFYALSGLRLLGAKGGPLARPADAAFTFVMLNAAAMVAFANFVTGRKAVWAAR